MGAALACATETADSFAATREAFENVLRVAGSEETQRMQHSDLERLLAEQGQQSLRQLYQDSVDRQAQAEVADEVVDAHGTQRTRKRTQQRELETIFGTVQVQRTGYGATGEASLHPLDAQLNLPAERYSLEVRRRAALEASKNSFDETVETLTRFTGAAVGKRQVEELVSRAAQDFDAFYEQRRRQPAGDQPAGDPRAPTDDLLVISSDGKGVVMHRQDLRPATRKASEDKRSKLATRLSKGEKRNRKRMATVAAVYSVARHVRTPEQMLAVLARAEEAEQQSSPRPRPQHKRVRPHSGHAHAAASSSAGWGGPGSEFWWSRAKRSLMIDARSWSMCCAASRVQVIPLPFMRAATTFLQALSTVPLPIGTWSSRYCR